MKFPIVKPVLPEQADYQRYISQVFERCYLTNNGPLLQALENRLAEYFNSPYVLLVNNGTSALHIAYAALGIKRAITTPFTFAATPGSMQFQGIECRFSDIHQETFNLDPDLLSQSDLAWADAIVPVHVFGNPCEVDKLSQLSKQHNLKVIYDAAHCFGARLDGQSLMTFGDCATISLHATKLFHCVEGGAIVFKHQADFERAKKLINFGQDEQQIPVLAGTNAKLSEVHAAMGLSLWPRVDAILSHRNVLYAHYKAQLTSWVTFQRLASGLDYNAPYMPVLLKDEAELLHLKIQLEALGIQTRRYFYPSLCELPAYGEPHVLPNSHDIASRILCLPMYFDLSVDDVSYICSNIIAILKAYRG